MTSAPDIGPELQKQRKARRLTLEQLARLSGVSKSMLSQIERGDANPTFAVLWGITRALAIDISELVGGQAVAGPGSRIEIMTAAPEIRSADGKCALRILSAPRLAGDVEWYSLSIDPGGVLDSDPHSPGAFEHFTATTGAFTVTSGDMTMPVRAGETARYRADIHHSIAHAGANGDADTGNEPATGFLVVLYR